MLFRSLSAIAWCRWISTSKMAVNSTLCSVTWRTSQFRIRRPVKSGTLFVRFWRSHSRSWSRTEFICSTWVFGFGWSFVFGTAANIFNVSVLCSVHTQGNGANCPDSLKMYEQLLDSMVPKVKYTKTEAFVPSFMEVWVFYQVKFDVWPHPLADDDELDAFGCRSERPSDADRITYAQQDTTATATSLRALDLTTAFYTNRNTKS